MPNEENAPVSEVEVSDTRASAPAESKSDYPYDDKGRSFITKALLLLLFLTVAMAGASVCCGCWPTMKELLEVLLPVETALLGSAVGYYFGTTRR
ncbi:MAG: hypothetical protein IT350_11265 [Deltaproteobacteria bacterium]|nr:hypothetical protein [Deltaproteobacteria bacterium]